MGKTKSIIKIEKGNLFFRKFHALKNIEIDIKEGEKIALLGHNGAGKSILIDVLAGVKNLNKGKVDYGLPNIREKMGIQFQAKDFPQGLKFKSLLDFYLNIYKFKIGDKRIQGLLVSFHIKHLLNRNLQSLSGGQKQKISIVFALLNKPKIIFIDEILTGLDITAQSQVLNLLIDYVKKEPTLTVISASHNELEIENLVDRAIVLKHGEIVDKISKKEIIKKYGSIVEYMSRFKEDDDA